MLDKTNYTTRTDLTKEQISALVTVRDKLETMEIDRFNMGTCSACIGHYVGRELGMDYEEAYRWTCDNCGQASVFQPLFFPHFHFPLSQLSRKDSVQAITNFLNDSNTPWDDTNA